MAVKKTLSALLLSAFVASPAYAWECDQQQADQNIQAGFEAGVIVDAGSMNGMPSISVDAAVWRNADYSTRLGIVKTFECAVAGPDSILAKIQVTNRGGKILAMWDGIERKLDIR